MVALPLSLVLGSALGRRTKPLTKDELAGKLNGIEAKDISDSPVPNLYQVAIGSDVAYVTKDGRYIFRGDIIDAATSTNITEQTRSRARVVAARLGRSRDADHVQPEGR